MPEKKCHRHTCLYPVSPADPRTHLVTGEEYCEACAKRINAACVDVYPRGVILFRSELPK